MPNNQPGPNEAQQVGSAGCLVKLFWSVAGNMILLLCLIALSQNRGLTFTAGDGVFWVIVVLMAAARWLDITRYHDTTGKPETTGDWWKYVAIMVGLSAAAWIAVHTYTFLAA